MSLSHGQILINELHNSSLTKQNVIDLIDFAIRQIKNGDGEICSESIAPLKRLKRKYLCLFPENIPSIKAFKISLIDRHEVINCLKILADSSEMEKANEIIKVIDRNYEIERRALKINEPNFCKKLTVAFKAFTTLHHHEGNL